MLIQNYDLDMVPSGIPLTIHVSQYDTDVQLVFRLFASHGTLNLNSGATVMIRGLKRDGHGISVPCAFAYANNIGTVTIQLTKQMTAVAGKNTFELYVKTYTGELYSANFILKKVAKRFNYFLEVHIVRKPAYIVMGLDNHGFSAQAGLYYIRIDSSLCKEIHSANFLCLFLKYTDKFLTYYLTLPFRLCYTCKLSVISVGCINTNKINIK